MTRYSGLGFTEQENRLFAVLTPAAARPPLALAELTGEVGAAGYGSFYLLAEALLAVVDAYNAGGELTLAIGERRDALFTLEVSADAMQVALSVTPSCGGRELVADEIYQALGAAAVTYGIDLAAIARACRATSAERVLIAAGTAPINGEDASFTLLVNDARERTPQIDAHGLIDFREQGAIPVVAADEPLMRRQPASFGSPGRNVRGETIEPVHGRDRPFAEHLVGAYVDKDDRNLLRAVFAGQPVRCGNGVNVEQILRVRNVNMATGNISFDGTINIEGEVLPGMKVHATGDIVVGDVVDGAELSADGDIRINGGVIAKAHVRAGGAVVARFVENAQISAGTTITIEDSALQSDLQANNQIIVGAKSRRARLAGGSARAMMLIRVAVLGSPTSGVTKLMLGVNPVLEQQYEDLLHRIEKLRSDEDALEKVVKHLNSTGDKAGMLERATASRQQVIQAWGALLPERDELERQLALTAGARVAVEVGVDGAVDLLFGKKGARLRRNYLNGTFLVSEDKVCFADGSGNVVAAN